MPSRKFFASLAVVSLPWWLGCVTEHELFRDVTGAGGSATGGSAGGGGTAGDPHLPGGSSTGGPPERSPAGTPCENDSECESQTFCDRDVCTACAAPVSCRAGFIVVKRNGCDWCAPPNECLTDANCGEEMKCLSGLQCDAGCDGSPSCCHGNLCGEADCGPPIHLDCSVVGCADGATCVGPARWSDCECEDDGWRCETMEMEEEEEGEDGSDGESDVMADNQCLLR